MFHRMKLRVIYPPWLVSPETPVQHRWWGVRFLSGLCALLLIPTSLRNQNKRWAMFFSALAAYVVYKGVSGFSPLTEASTLILVSGLFSIVVALLAYAWARNLPLPALWKEAPKEVGWLAVRVGLVYAALLSLMVLSLLKVAGYDFLLHPVGPGLMAMMIAAASVARDAYEIGHLRSLTGKGTTQVWTFPDGHGLWTLLKNDPLRVGGLLLPAVGLSLGLYVTLALMVGAGKDLTHLLIGGILSGASGTYAYFSGMTRKGTVKEVLSFFLWPAFSFSLVYLLIVSGIRDFVLLIPTHSSLLEKGLTAGCITSLMAVTCYGLGSLKQAAPSEADSKALPAELLKCPFVLSILRTGIPSEIKK